MTPPLKPCPKIGCLGRPSVVGFGQGHENYVSCNRCGACGARANTTEEAAKLWNEAARFALEEAPREKEPTMLSEVPDICSEADLINDRTVALLEQALKAAKSGKMQEVLIVGLLSDESIATSYTPTMSFIRWKALSSGLSLVVPTKN